MKVCTWKRKGRGEIDLSWWGTVKRSWLPHKAKSGTLSAVDDVRGGARESLSHLEGLLGSMDGGRTGVIGTGVRNNRSVIVENFNYLNTHDRINVKCIENAKFLNALRRIWSIVDSSGHHALGRVCSI